MESQYLNSVARTSSANDQIKKTTSRTSSNTLTMDSFLALMAQQLQNQDPLNPTSQDNYMMQLAQMAVVESMNSMTQLSISTYASSMIGKEVTVADYDSKGNITSVKGTVTGVSFYYSEPIIYIGDKGYTMSQIMNVGKVPDGSDSGDGGETTPTDPDEGTEDNTSTETKEV